MNQADSQFVKAQSQEFAFLFEDFLSRTYSGKGELHAAIRYCLEGRGKRVRAHLAMFACEALGGLRRHAIPGAIAVEMIHAYSLVHDDLPCMDDDDMRRGRPSVHKAFDEATALLVGDALLTDAFRVLSDKDFFWEAGLLSAEQSCRAIALLSKACGSHGMVLGQSLDLFWTGKGTADLNVLKSIHLGKTGALMGAACALGAISAGASQTEVTKFQRFGELIGLAFQAIDDTIDGLGSTGKTAGKDRAQGKLTFLEFMSVEETVELSKELTEQAFEIVGMTGEIGQFLKSFVHALVFRQS
jgi:geranylgeranyl pyrophosphate synthase